MKLYVADKETGTFIEEVQNIEEGLEIIKKYEEQDKNDNVYEENFYDIVNEDHITQIY